MLEEGGVKLALTVRFLNININLNDHWPIAHKDFPMNEFQTSELR